MNDILNIGDWICFMENGMLVIGEIRYVKEPDVIGNVVYVTINNGEVSHNSVLEVRKKD